MSSGIDLSDDDLGTGDEMDTGDTNPDVVNTDEVNTDEVNSGALDEALARVVAGLPGGGEARLGQKEMARAVARVIEEHRHLVVRAGTGTGKSLGYLIPSVLSPGHVVVATATKALQDQLATKDLPLIEAGLSRSISFSVLKGRSNYLCKQRQFETVHHGEQLEIDARETSTGPMAEQMEAISRWAETTVSGDRAELAFDPDSRVWSSFSVGADECPGAFRCPFGDECFAERARDQAADADVVIVNHHLLGAHLASGGAILPEFDTLVVDEAHDLEEVLSSSLGANITAGRFRALSQAARALHGDASLEDAASATMEVAQRIDAALALRKGQRIRLGDDRELEELLELARVRLERLEATVGPLLADIGGPDEQRGPRAQRVLLVSGRLREHIGSFARLDANAVAWVNDADRPALQIAPIDLREVCKDELFRHGSVIFTSATVLLDLADRLGAPRRSVESMELSSPFPYEEHALLYCAASLPDRRSVGATDAIVEEIVLLIEAAEGRALVLFTSHKAMTTVSAAVRDRLDLPILVQGEASKSALLEQFSAQASASLFATMGFWQGIDVPGQTCSLVIIDRIPFPRPDDPLLSARREQAGSSGFRTVDLPRAMSLLAQGVGRLVRNAEDRGVVAVLDPRLATASYRWELVRALPPMRRTKEQGEAVAFFRELVREEKTRTQEPNGGTGLSSRARR